MVNRDSILRRLPPTLNGKKVLFLDGIRHAGEIAGLAYARLQQHLTHIALEDDGKNVDDAIFTAAFLDAWALVDVIDRFRALWLLMPNAVLRDPPPGKKSFTELTEPLRNLRNVADHLAQRAEYVVSRSGCALGELSWYTGRPPDGRKGIICTIVPGTIRPGSRFAVNPAGQKVELPTGLIHLTAGEYTVNLSELIPEMAFRIKDLEKGLERSIADSGLEPAERGADLLIRIEGELEPLEETAPFFSSEYTFSIKT
jgi:hypothetical protein